MCACLNENRQHYNALYAVQIISRGCVERAPLPLCSLTSLGYLVRVINQCRQYSGVTVFYGPQKGRRNDVIGSRCEGRLAALPQQ